MALKSPTVGSKGLWQLNGPYETKLPVNVAMECTAISNYNQLGAMGVDVYETYYKALDIEQSVYLEHLKDGCIVFVKTDTNNRYAFPLHYLDRYPIGTGVQYVSFGVGMRLGALPLDTDTEGLKRALKETVEAFTGAETDIVLQALSEIYIIENEQHEKLVKARENLRKEVPVKSDVIDNLTNTVKELKVKLKLAEDELVKLKTPPATAPVSSTQPDVVVSPTPTTPTVTPVVPSASPVSPAVPASPDTPDTASPNTPDATNTTGPQTPTVTQPVTSTASPQPDAPGTPDPQPQPVAPVTPVTPTPQP